jgi:large subunit ribosomal protein L10
VILMEKKGRKTIRPEKLQEVEEIAKLIGKYKVAGIIDLYKTPAATMQKIKTMLRGKMVVRAAKNSIMIRALEKAGKKQLVEYVKGYPCLILTDMDPFKIYNFLQKNKIPAAAKAGDIPKKDVEVKAGPTDLMPGPAISTLTKVKIPAKVEGGKIGIMRDFVALKAGQPLSVDLAAAFQLLKLKPMENGLNVSVLQEGGIAYKGEQLLVDEAKVLNDIQRAIQSAFNLSINSSYPTKETIGFIISKAYLNAKQLASETKIEV